MPLQFPDFYGDAQRAYGQAKETKRVDSLRGLMGDYYGKQDPMLGKLAALGGDAAGMQKEMRGQQEAQAKELAQHAQVYLAIPESQKQAYYEAQVRPMLRERGIDAPWSPQVDQTAQKLVEVYGGGSGPGGMVQSTYVDAQGNRVGIMRDGTTRVLGQNAPNVQLVQGENGYVGVNKATLVGEPVMMGGGMPQGQPPQQTYAGGQQQPSGGFLEDAMGVASRFGFQPTSMVRSPAENASLPGSIPNSRHLSGQAIDLSIRGKSQQEIQAITAEMQAKGYSGGIDMQGTAPHLHFEQRGGGSGGQAAPQGGPQQLRPKPDERLDLARQANARAAEANARAAEAARVAALGNPGVGQRWNASHTAVEPIPGYQSPSAIKPMPPSALRLLNEERDMVRTSGNINTNIDKWQGWLTKGTLKLGPVQNAASGVRNWAGMSDEASKNYASFRAGLEQMRNDSLRLNKGVQTDGDAVRAWNELLANINDPGVVAQRLAEIKTLNERALLLHQSNVETTLQNYGRDPSGASAKPAPAGNDFSHLWNQ